MPLPWALPWGQLWKVQGFLKGFNCLFLHLKGRTNREKGRSSNCYFCPSSQGTCCTQCLSSLPGSTDSALAVSMQVAYQKVVQRRQEKDTGWAGLPGIWQPRPQLTLGAAQGLQSSSELGGRSGLACPHVPLEGNVTRQSSFLQNHVSQEGLP